MANLADMRITLRRRLSELDEGLWSDEELKEFLNEAQTVLARDVHSRNHPWSSYHQNMIPVISGAQYYYMPPDFMSLESIAHFRDGYLPRKLVKTNLKHIRLNSNQQGYDSLYQYYEVRGRAAPYIARGVCTQSASNALHDTRGNFSAVAIGDIVHNLTDNSHATVVGFNGGNVTVADWVGGNSMAFYVGDEYRVQQAERDRDLVWVWPVQEFNQPHVYKGPPEQFRLGYEGDRDVQRITRDRQITNLLIRFSRLPEDWSQGNQITVVVRDAAGNLGDDVAESIFGVSRVKTGWNDVNIVPFRLYANTEYWVDAFVNNDDYPITHPDSPFKDSIKMDTVELQTRSNNALELSYIARPRRLANDASICEFPPEAESALYAYAKMLAYEKKNPDGDRTVGMLNIYESQLQKFKQYLELRDESGNDLVGGEVAAFYNQAPGFTEFYGD